MNHIKANVSLKLQMREDETQEEAEKRLYDLLCEGLSCTADHTCDFWIEETQEES